MAEFGITRVGDITGLDRVGLPVAQACRPSARSNAVTQGKGSTVISAGVGAVLECLEMAAGEDPSRLTPWSGPVSDQDIAQWRPLAPPGINWPQPCDAYLRGVDIVTGACQPVPAAVVDTDFAVSGAAQTAPIIRSSIGLGAGTHLAEAMWQGLLELVENDARLREAAAPPASNSDLDWGALGPCSAMAACDAAGLRVRATNITQRSGPICLSVQVMEDPARASALPLPAEGFAARMSTTEAFEAALAEALQARLALISGAREDMTQALYDAAPPAALRQLAWAHCALPGAPPPANCPVPAAPQAVAAQLADQGCGPILAVPLLHREDVPLAIVRMVAPRLIADPDRLSWDTAP